MIHSRTLAIAALAASLACASSSSTSSLPRRSAQLITQQEIAEAAVVGNAYDVIKRLRPNFLSSRGQTTVHNAQSASAYPNIYLDGVAYGDINTLRNLDASQIGEIRMYQAWEAQTKFGMGNSAGVIAITTRK